VVQTNGRRRARRLLLGLLATLIVGWFLLGVASDPLAELLWFQNVGFESVWTTQFGYSSGLLILGVAVPGAFLLANLALVWRLSGDPSDADLSARAQVHTSPYPREGRYTQDDWVAVVAALPRAAIRAAFVALAGLVALVFGVALMGSWQTVALWLHGGLYDPSGPSIADPIFGLDLGWWLFQLPFLHLLAGTIGSSLFVALLLTGLGYGVAALRGADVRGPGPLFHLAVLGGLWLVSVAAGQWLGRYDLAYQQNGAVVGVTATDAAVRLMLAAVTAGSTIVLALVLLALAAARGSRVAQSAALVVGVWYALLLIGGVVAPWAYQRLVVVPNENSAEAPYIANNISLTRRAFALDAWQVQSYTGKVALTAGDISADATTLDNARLWDYRPLSATLDQLQTVRQYYDFTSVDIDRYAINGQPTEVMLSAREMALDKSQTSPTWIAAHILYTHGYGLAMVPVNGVDGNGLPNLLIKDLPTAVAPGAPAVAQPRIYFGERPSGWVLAGATSDEFDYPSSVGNANDVTTRYGGAAGLSLGSPLARLFWGFHLGDLNLLISDQVTSATKLLLNRSLTSRLGALVPFLSLDPDPYLVVGPEGRLVWVQDAYTTTGAVPGATATTDATLGATYDYIRNSVKITMDAYDGSVHFYLADPSDPLIRAWAAVFPTVFEPLSAMPAGIAAHLRTPEAMFNAQAQMFARYHVTDVASFYKSDNLWTVPSVNEGNDQVVMPQAYYVEIRLPDQPQPEFVLIQPMVPVSRPNMIAWVAARNDGPLRGQVIVYQLPSSTTIQGPSQIEARIDQDPVISGQISLWNQSGSKVIRGNLLVIPVGTSFLYLEPIYLQSTSSAFPQLTKIVVASSQTIAWSSTLQGALEAMVSGAGTGGATASGGGGSGQTGGPGAGSATPSPSPHGGSGGGLPTDVPGLIRYANAHFVAAKAAQAGGDFVTYGKEMQQVQSALEALDTLTGGALAPSPTPSPASAP
jgi:uncharacterized membrane protein (UPF0182 family)